MNTGKPRTTHAQTLTLWAAGAIVVALLLPFLNVQRDRARRARCLSHLRSIGAAMHLYANDFHGWLPAVSQLGGDGVRGSGENGFDRHACLLLNFAYATGPSIFVCPSDREDGDPSKPLSEDGASGHAMVRVATGGPTWVPAVNVRWFNNSYVYVAGFTIRDRPDFLLLADEHWSSEGDCPAECRHDLDAFDNHGKAGRNVLYLGGRGEWLPGISLDEAYAPIQKSTANYRTRTVD